MAIEHIVIIVKENHTFDNYFGTYPKAANIPGEQSWIGVPAPAADVPCSKTEGRSG